METTGALTAHTVVASSVRGGCPGFCKDGPMQRLRCRERKVEPESPSEKTSSRGGGTGAAEDGAPSPGLHRGIVQQDQTIYFYLP
jgi:hypothetical protein